jgi:hypothetical protein
MRPLSRPTRLARRMFGEVQDGWLVKDAETDTTIGWVVKRGARWRSYVVPSARRHSHGTGQGVEVGWGFARTRAEAVAEVEIQREV